MNKLGRNIINGKWINYNNIIKLNIFNNFKIYKTYLIKKLKYNIYNKNKFYILLLIIKIIKK